MNKRDWDRMIAKDRKHWNKHYHRILPSILPFTKKYKYQQLDMGICLGGTINPKWKTIKRINSIFEIRKLGFENINRYKNKKRGLKFKNWLEKASRTVGLDE